MLRVYWSCDDSIVVEECQRDQGGLKDPKTGHTCITTAGWDGALVTSCSSPELSLFADSLGTSLSTLIMLEIAFFCVIRPD